MELNTEQYNRELKQWGKSLRDLMRVRISLLGIKGKTELLKQIKSPQALAELQHRMDKEGILKKYVSANYKAQDGEIFRIGIKFPRQGVWVQKGVGFKHPVSNPRQIKDWFNAPLDARVPQLANLVVKCKADKALNLVMAERMKIQ